MIDLARASWPMIPAGPLVLVPLGSTEQHGPHLPFTTDSVIAEAVARRMPVGDDPHSARPPVSRADSARAGSGMADTVIVPAVRYGASGEHQAFPGTISIGHEALEIVIVELVRSLSTWAGRILFVNAHGGNIQSLAAAIPRLVAEQHAVAWVPCGVVGGDAHAGRTETSLMLHLAPDEVDLTRAAAGNIASMRDLLPALRTGGVRAVSPSGILGDPRGASAEEGEAILGDMVDGLRRRVERWNPDTRGCLVDAGVTVSAR